MQWLMKRCARGALGLGAAALLLAGVPAHAGPASGEAVLAPAGETTWQEKGVKELGQGQEGAGPYPRRRLPGKSIAPAGSG